MSTRKTVVFTHVADVGPAGPKNGADVLEDPIGLLRDPAIHQLPLAGSNPTWPAVKRNPLAAIPWL